MVHLELNNSNKDLTKLVRKGTFVRNDYMESVDKELKHNWKEAKMKSEEKVNWNTNKHKVKKDTLEGIYKGVLIGDSELKKFEEEIAVTEKKKMGIKQSFMQE